MNQQIKSMKGFVLTVPQSGIKALAGWIDHFTKAKRRFCVLKEKHGYCIFREGERADGYIVELDDLLRGKYVLVPQGEYLK